MLIIINIIALSYGLPRKIISENGEREQKERKEKLTENEKGRHGVLSLHTSFHVSPAYRPHTRQNGCSSKLMIVFWAMCGQ